MAINPYLSFPGNSKEVIAFYEEVFHTKADIMGYDDLPEGEEMEMGVDMTGKVMHSEMKIEGATVMISDDPYNVEVKKSNISLGVFADDKKRIREYFEKLAEEGEVIMPLEKTFWSELFGIVKDKYEIEWLFNYERE